MQNWTVNHHVFAVRASSETNSIVQTQTHIRCKSNVPMHRIIPSLNAILKWVDNFSIHVSSVNKSFGPARSIHTTENTEWEQ